MSRRTIVNNAIIFLGRERITSLEDNRPEVQAALELLNEAIDHCLTDDLWNVGVKFLQLNLSASDKATPPNWIRYELPENFLTVKSLQIMGSVDPHNSSATFVRDVEDYKVRERDLLVKKRFSTTSNEEETTNQYWLEYTHKERDSLESQFNLYCGFFLASLLAAAFAPSHEIAGSMEARAEIIRDRIVAQQASNKSSKRSGEIFESKFL